MDRREKIKQLIATLKLRRDAQANALDMVSLHRRYENFARQTLRRLTRTVF